MDLDFLGYSLSESKFEHSSPRASHHFPYNHEELLTYSEWLHWESINVLREARVGESSSQGQKGDDIFDHIDD